MNPIIVQHCFGKTASGGPIVAMERLLASSPIPFFELRQLEPAGGFNAALVFRFVNELKSVRPDLIHIRGLGNEGFHAALAAKLAGVPNILVSVHGTHRDLKYPDNRLRHWIVANILEPATLLMATHVATVCKFAAERPFIKRYHQKLIAIVPNGVTIPKLDKSPVGSRNEFSLPRDLPLGVMVSRVTKEKGYFVLARALRILDSVGCRFALLIVGGGDGSGEIRKHFNGLNNIIVRFAGHRTDVANFLSDADFFVFPSLHENLSNALLEAMSYALPVVATDVGGNTEVLRRGGGVLVPPGMAEPLAIAIKQLIGDAELRRKLGADARQVVIESYSVNHMVNSWLEVYEKILGRQIA